MIKVVFFGTDNISVPTLRALIDDNRYEVVGVVTKPDAVKGRRGHQLDSPEVAKIARAHNIALFQPPKLADIADELKSLPADIGVLVSYGKIIPATVIDIFPHGIVNFHPSMLPVYRGPSPIETAIMHGDSFTGLSLMALSPTMDAGDVYYQEKITINPDATTADLYHQFGQRGAELVTDKLEQIVAGKLVGIPQDDDLAIYCHLLTKADGDLNPSTMTARDCYNRWRAIGATIKCRIQLARTTVIVSQLKPLDNFAGDSWDDIIPCQGNSAIQLIEIISPKSGKKMKVADYLNGLK
ncbi:MAG: methionyl-tRNA formyltransferase [Candidatus Saccharibacteria bacterium]|nr:methionyl-tRNA formyltransferase [Candidatus Saccharibacteria bacterium]